MTEGDKQYTLIAERRPPKDSFELDNLENAAFFKMVNEIHKNRIEEEKNKPKEEFLKFRNTSLKQLEKQFKGKKFGKLVLYHTKIQSPKEIGEAINELRSNIYPALIITTDKFIHNVVYEFSKTETLWKHDCGETLKIYITATKVEAEKFNLKVSDDYAFDIFNIIVLSLALRAVREPEFKNFIKKSIKKYWFF